MLGESNLICASRCRHWQEWIKFAIDVWQGWQRQKRAGVMGALQPGFKEQEEYSAVTLLWRSRDYAQAGKKNMWERSKGFVRRNLRDFDKCSSTTILWCILNPHFSIIYMCTSTNRIDGQDSGTTSLLPLESGQVLVSSVTSFSCITVLAWTMKLRDAAASRMIGNYLNDSMGHRNHTLLFS